MIFVWFGDFKTVGFLLKVERNGGVIKNDFSLVQFN